MSYITQGDDYIGGATAEVRLNVLQGERKVVGIQVMDRGAAHDIAGWKFATHAELYSAQYSFDGAQIYGIEKASNPELSAWDTGIFDASTGVFQVLVPQLFQPENPNVEDRARPAAICHVQALRPDGTVHEMRMVVGVFRGSALAVEEAVLLPVQDRPIHYHWETSLGELSAAPTVHTGDTVLSNDPPPRVGLPGTQTAGREADPGYTHALRASAKAELDNSVVARMLADPRTGLADERAENTVMVVSADGVWVPSQVLNDLVARVTALENDDKPVTQATYHLGIKADAQAPVTADFTVSGMGALAVPDIPAGQRRYIIGAKRVSDGPITAVYYYEPGHENDRNRLGSVFVPGAGVLNLGGVDHSWVRSRVALPSDTSGNLVRIV